MRRRRFAREEGGRRESVEGYSIQSTRPFTRSVGREGTGKRVCVLCSHIQADQGAQLDYVGRALQFRMYL